jgi:hypothetical protein
MRRVSNKQAAQDRAEAWKQALREGRVVRWEGFFRSFKTPEAAAEYAEKLRQEGCENAQVVTGFEEDRLECPALN